MADSIEVYFKGKEVPLTFDIADAAKKTEFKKGKNAIKLITRKSSVVTMQERRGDVSADGC